MAAKRLYCTITNSSGIISVVVAESHDGSSANATFEVTTTSLDIGDLVEIDLGYTDNHSQVFRGYVKQINRQVPNNTYSILASDVMIRAMDYFIAESNPEQPLKYSNISAESLIGSLMAKAGLTNYDGQTSYFTFGVQKEFEINLVPVFEYCRAIADNLTWTIWADSNGQIHFRNRKPYVMVNEYPENTQPGWQADSNTTGYVLYDYLSLDQDVSTSEKNLRNRVVVYGSESLHAEASRSVSMLPPGFYKTAVLSNSAGMIDTTELAQKIADYNLDLFCRYTEEFRVTVLGDPILRARTCIDTDLTRLGISGLWYVANCEHVLNSGGYTCALSLRRMIKA